MAGRNGVLVCDEVSGEKLAAMTGELLSLGRRLADQAGYSLSALLLGRVSEAAAREAVALGADKVYLAETTLFLETHPEVYLETVLAADAELRPLVVLLGHTDFGREIAPRLAGRLAASVCLNCTDVSFDRESGELLQTRPVYGGNALAVWASRGYEPYIVTVKPRAVPAAAADPSRTGEIQHLAAVADAAKIRGRLVESVREETKGVKLEEAKVIVAGGGGIGSKEGFGLLEELARILGGAVGATRVPCDEGWVPVSLEIGQTGRTVTPDLYVAVGISGAVQHMAGCSGAKYIAAINRDPEAHIFREADLGLVGDYREVIPALIESLKSLPA